MYFSNIFYNESFWFDLMKCFIEFVVEIVDVLRRILGFSLIKFLVWIIID